jgi:hypothetical protein
MSRATIRLLAVLASGTLPACATTGATLGSGVGDADLEHPPYYAGRGVRSPSDVQPAVGHLPIVYQRGAAQVPVFDPDLTEDMQGLLREMNAYLDSLGSTRLLVSGGRVSAVTHAATRQPPDVRFGCITESGDPEDECFVDEGSVLGRTEHRMRLSVGRPAPEWTEWMDEVLANQGAEHVLVITLEVGQYLVRQQGVRGLKRLGLGTSHVVELPWLTSLETPVTVLQLTGALVERGGRAVRIGAEGLLAHRTAMKISAFGAQELISDEDVRRLRSDRRQDLQGAPLTWQVGLRTLVTTLLAAPEPPSS